MPIATGILKEEILLLRGHFYWDFGHNFFIECPGRNFVWSSDEYGGKNTLKETRLSFIEWRKVNGREVCRDKGMGSLYSRIPTNVLIEIV